MYSKSKKYISAGFASVFGGAIACDLIWYRPLPDPLSEDGKFDGPNRRLAKYASNYSLSDFSDKYPPILHMIGQQVITFSMVSIARFYMYSLGRFRIVYNQNYYNFVGKLQYRDIEEQPIITVSNHRSLFDEPMMVSSILPYSMSIQSKYLRYSICAQEYCFNKRIPDFFFAVNGAFNVLPIWRGGGINQKLLLDFARYGAAGKWLHIFPEGAIWQNDYILGGRWRHGTDKQCGNLKWGIGKLIAHAPIRPIVIPFYHHGMEHILPQHPVTKILLHSYPQLGHKVTVVFGEEIQFDDLIEEYEVKYGKLWKYSASIDQDIQKSLHISYKNTNINSNTMSNDIQCHNSTINTMTNISDNKENDAETITKISELRSNYNYHDYWDTTTDAERELYHKITLRIDKALLNLNRLYHSKYAYDD